MEYPHEWTVAYRSFDDNPFTSNLSDTQCVYAIACVGSKRTAYWDGQDWTYTEHKAKLYPTKKDAAEVMRDHHLFKYCRLVAQPHPSIPNTLPFWPTVDGWHHNEA